MDWEIVVLVLGILGLLFATYFTHVVLRSSGGTMEMGVTREGLNFKISAEQRNLVLGDVRAASAERGVPADEEKVDAALGDGEELRRARALWVDDNPEGNVHERRMLERLHVDIDLARSTDDALAFLVGRPYDLIITDLTRPNADGTDNRTAGLDFLRFLARAPEVPPVLVYAGLIDERAGEALRYGARTATAVPSELLQATVDVLRSS